MPPIHWQPLRMLPTLTAMAEEARADSTDQLANFRAAQERPYSLDDATIAHAERVYTEQGQFLGIYAEQCRRWQQSTSSPRQQQALSHLASVVAQATTINVAIRSIQYLLSIQAANTPDLAAQACYLTADAALAVAWRVLCGDLAPSRALTDALEAALLDETPLPWSMINVTSA